MNATPEETFKRAAAVFAQNQQEHPQNQPRSRVNVAEYLSHYGKSFKVKQNGTGTLYCLETCLFDPSHVRESSIIQGADGVLRYQCFHDSCQGRTWKDARELISGAESLKPFMNSHGSLSTSAEDGTEPKPCFIDTAVPKHDPLNFPDAWPQPLPLPDELPPVEPFAMDLLPTTLKSWAADITDRFQCPPDFVGAAIMAALASVVGRKIGIRPQARTDWTTVPNLWALLVGRSGVMKSPAMEAALAPLKRLAAQEGETFQLQQEEYQGKARLLKIRSEEAEKAARAVLKKNPQADVASLLAGEDLEVPTLRRYIVNDTTVAALGELLRHNQNGFLTYRDEMVSLLKGLEREDAAGDRGFYLTAWNGDSSYTIDRIGRGLNLYIPAVCLSLLGSTQPARIAEYIRHAVKGTSGDDGLIQRFSMLVWPDMGSDWKDIDRWPDHEAKQVANKVFEYLDKLNPLGIGAVQDKGANGEPEGIPYLRFDDAGRELFLEWRTTLENNLRGGDLSPALESHFSKYRKLIPAIALLIHLAEEKTGPVGVPSVLAALAWGDYLETHARRAYASITNPDVSTAKAIIVKLKRGEVKTTFSAMDIYHNGWSGLSEPKRVRDALTFLEDLDWLSSSTTSPSVQGGRPKVSYTVNPRGLL